MRAENKTIKDSDILIIGAGPAGLFSAFQCGMLGFRCLIVDSLPHIGGQCTALYPEKPIYDIPAHPSVFGGELIEKLERQTAAFKPDYILGQAVTSLSGEMGNFSLTTDKHMTIQTKAIIIAGGAGCFGPNRPPLDDILSYEDKSVFYSVRHKESLRGKKIMIAGGGDSAVDWALALIGIADEIHLVHRRDKFRAAPASLDCLNAARAAGKIFIHTPHQLKSLTGSDSILSSVEIEDMDGKATHIKCDVLLPFFGLSTHLGPMAEWGLNLHKQTIEIDPKTAATNIKGIYAVGDIAHYEHKLKLILTGFAEAAAAAHSARRDLYPDEVHHFEYSTTKGVPAS